MPEAVLPNGGADAPAEPNAAPIETPVDVPNPVGSQTPVAENPPEPTPEEKPKTAGDAVRKAMEKVKAEQAAKDAEKAKAPESKAEQPKEQAKAAEAPKEPAKPAERTPDGKFAARTPEANAQPAEQQQSPQEQERSQKPAGIHEAPARFDTAAKAEWANAPESVKGAVHRTIRELEAGIEEHRQRWEPIKKYDDMAKQYQTDLPSALERYVAMDTLLSKDLAQGLDSIIRDKTGGQAGLREFVAHLTGQKPDEAQSRNDATMHGLRQEIAELKQQLGGVTNHVQQQTAASIAAFAADKSDFGALSPMIVEHINAGKSLEAAYEAAKQDAATLAQSLGFVPAQTSQPLSPAPSPAPLKPAGQKSVSGAPATGSDPASSKKAPASSIREALERARSRVA